MKNLNLIPVFAGSVLVALSTLQLSPTLAAGDVEKGKKVAKKCLACHTLNKGGKNRLGPNLYGVLDRAAGEAEGYKYSKSLKNSGIIWSEHIFDGFITKPRKVIKGTKMSFRGLKKATQRADLLAYFRTLRDELPGDEKVGGNVEDGKRVAEKYCAVCHSFDKGGRVLFGPNLFDIAGKPAAAIEGFRYSQALKNSGLVWNEKNIIAFMSNPEQFVKGTTARFPGLKSSKDKLDIVAYLKTLK